MDRNRYISKGEEFLNGPEFVEIDEDPTKSFQDKVQRSLLAVKKCFDSSTYDRIYPSAARPGLFYGLAKVHKISSRIGREDADALTEALPLRPVISNIGTATYELSKYLAGVLKPLTKSEYAVESSKDFVTTLANKSLPPDFELVSFDVVSLFTKVPLDYTIEIILRKIYDEHRISTKIPRQDLKKLLYMCTKEMHFIFNKRGYRQVDGVAMGSPLGPVIANIFMSELESTLVPLMSDDISFWARYVDDTFAFVRRGSKQRILDRLNSFHPNIRFTDEVEVEGRIAFLDVLVTTNPDRSFNTEVYRKPTDTNIYIHWQAFAPKAWKTGTLRGLIRRAFILCSTDEAREREIAHLKKVFRGLNGYPSRVVNSTIREVEAKFRDDAAIHHVVEANDDPTTVEESVPASTQATQETQIVATPFITLPYKGKEGEAIIRKFREAVHKALPPSVKPRIVHTGTKISTFFQVKDPVPLEHQTDLCYRFLHEDVTRYVGETQVRNGARNQQHLHLDKTSSIYKFINDNEGVNANEENFEILEKGLKNRATRKLAESLYIKEYNPDLNVRARSYKLVLFN